MAPPEEAAVASGGGFPTAARADVVPPLLENVQFDAVTAPEIAPPLAVALESLEEENTDVDDVRLPSKIQ